MPGPARRAADGQEGLELAFDDWLAGKPGAKRVIRDRMGHVVEDLDLVRAPQPGRDITLSIDRRIQFLAYNELKNTIQQYEPRLKNVQVRHLKSEVASEMVLQFEITAQLNLPDGRRQSLRFSTAQATSVSSSARRAGAAHAQSPSSNRMRHSRSSRQPNRSTANSACSATCFSTPDAASVRH